MKFPLDYDKNNGITALGIASLKGYRHLIQLLVEAGSEINHTSKNGIGALYLAIKGNHYDCSKYLLDKGAHIYLNDPVKADFSPIFFAIR
jgi:ankyrin repeat protein